MSEWKLEVTLRQLTPLVHFQHAQPGATLRATEVKPKLDRFLLLQSADDKLREVLIRADTGKKEREALKAIAAGHKDWCLPSVNEDADPALNYKLRIEGIDDKNGQYSIFTEYKKRRKEIGALFSLDEETYDASFYREVKLTILCFIPELLDQIKKYITMFFAVHNFGYRQNKGFGSFKVETIQNMKQSANPEKLVKQYIEPFVKAEQAQLYQIKLPSMLRYDQMLDIIADFNQIIKSGYNPGYNSGDNYVPSKLEKEYPQHCSYHCMNEKKAMKQWMSQVEGLDISRLTKREHPDFKGDISKAVYLRGVLGFASHYEFLQLRFKGVPTRIDFLLECDREIGRFASPIYFLPVPGSGESFAKILLIVSKRAYRRVLEQNPTITLKATMKGTASKALKGKAPISLHLPPEEAIDLFDFFAFLCDQKYTGRVKSAKNKVYRLSQLFFEKAGEANDK